jgi:hypothetical protein
MPSDKIPSEPKRQLFSWQRQTVHGGDYLFYRFSDWAEVTPVVRNQSPTTQLDCLIAGPALKLAQQMIFQAFKDLIIQYFLITSPPELMEFIRATHLDSIR